MAIDHPKLAQPFKQSRRLLYQRDDIIVRAGDVPSGVYYIVSGSVKVYSLCKDGEPNILMTLDASEIFPVAWAVSGITRDVGFAALDVTELRRIDRQEFLEALHSDIMLMRAAMQVLAGHFFTLTSEIDNLQYRSAREKVVFRLLFLASHFGHTDGNNATIAIRVTNDYIARSTNMTRETASRELSRLNRKQLICTVNGRIMIPDLLRLRDEISQRFNLATLSLD
ncbi:MAG TPA: Crp/Fnr family transcriptional regulator [Candidatus Dormibacteraeota bacterium]|nr:Crp/Fnr family transcriptional regulator [Candidatus Dormibacteraeota bacterium]